MFVITKNIVEHLYIQAILTLHMYIYIFKTQHAWSNINDVITNYKKKGYCDYVSWYLYSYLHARAKERENLCSNIRSLWSNTQANEYKSTVEVSTPTALYLPCYGGQLVDSATTQILHTVKWDMMTTNSFECIISEFTCRVAVSDFFVQTADNPTQRLAHYLLKKSPARCRYTSLFGSWCLRWIPS
jgi:hypothetical protein